MGLKRMLNVAKDDAGFASEGGVSRRTFLKVSGKRIRKLPVKDQLRSA